ncbi:MAG: hypothetical protein IKP67_09285 [Spirochaetales bacterium]|nr:hypothetical protein [Spirochaetales bacterium]
MLKKTLNLAKILKSDDYYENKLKFWAWGTLIVVCISWLLIPIGGIIGWNIINSTFPMRLVSAGVGLLAGVGLGFLMKRFWLILGDTLGVGDNE